MRRLTVLGLLCLLSACNDRPQDATAPLPAVAKILVTPVEIVLEAGGEAMVQAQADDASGTPVGGVDFRFESSNPAIEISEQGVVRSRGPVVSGASVVVKSGSHEERIPVVVRPGPLQRLERVSGENQAVVAGEPVPEPLVVRAVDQYGNVLAGVELEAKAGDQALPELATRTDEQGVAQMKPPAQERPGRIAIDISAAGGSTVSTSFGIEVAPGSPARIEVVESEASAEGGGEEAAPQPISIRVSDRFGNAVPGVEIGAEIDGEKMEPALRTDANGVSTMNMPVSTEAQGPRTLTVYVASDPAVSTKTKLPAAEARDTSPASQ